MINIVNYLKYFYLKEIMKISKEEILTKAGMQQIDDIMNHILSTSSRHLFAIRGHQGSGKSTFAKALSEYIQEKYGIECVHLERDKYFEEGGLFHGKSLFDVSKELERKYIEDTKAVLKNVENQVVIVSDTMTKITYLNRLNEMLSGYNKNLRKEKQMDMFVFRMQNHFDNVHDVPSSSVKIHYNNIHKPENQWENEFKIEPSVLSPSKPAFPTMNRNDLPFDENKKSKITEEYLQTYQSSLFSKKPSVKHKGLSVVKYKNSAFYNNDFDDALLEMRGTILDNHNNIIVRSFKKVFNYGEMINKNSQYKTDLKPETMVYGVVKVNGFLGNATYVDLNQRSNLVHKKNKDDLSQNYDKQVIYSTTGTTDSEYAKLVEKHLSQYQDVFKQFPNKTFSFEINDESDPHIIKEELGETLIGMTDVETAYQATEHELDVFARHFNMKRPMITELMPFSKLLAMSNDTNLIQHEGFMVFDENHQLKCKLKSKYYLMTKFLARNLNDLDKKIKKGKEIFDEEYYDLIDYIKNNEKKFFEKDEQGRINMIENFFNDFYQNQQKVKQENKKESNHQNKQVKKPKIK